MPKAVGMMSGGLDSTLAVRTILNHGIDVLGVSFKSAFFGPKKAEAAAAMLGVELRVIDISESHLEMTKSPKHGYGGNMNPCIDCHGMMFKYSIELMKEVGADFVFSGEVLGQRPMSQNRNALRVVAKLSGEPEMVVRPMSAQCLPETEPERQGIIDRSRLLDISGRSRKRQMALAKEWGIENYPLPAGGCLLTDPGFSRRLGNMFEHNPECTPYDIELLKVGRHMWLNDDIRVIIGRDEKDNNALAKLEGSEFRFVEAVDFIGPLVLLCGDAKEEEVREAGAICAAYGRGANEKSLSIRVSLGNNDAPSELINITPGVRDSYAGRMIR